MVSPNKSFAPQGRANKLPRGQGQVPQSPKTRNDGVVKKKATPRRLTAAPTPVSPEPEAGPSQAREKPGTFKATAGHASSGARIAGGNASARKKAKAQNRKYTHIPPNEEERARNGRQEGRSLISWKHPRMYEMLVLHINYECYRHSIELPWDHVAHRLHPGSTPGALQQAFCRLRPQLIAEGHLVPPPIPKPGQKALCDHTVRGQVRADEHGEPFVVRNVSYSEHLPHRKFNLPDAVDFVQGIGNASSRTKTPVEISVLGADATAPSNKRSGKKRAAAAAAGPAESPKRIKIEDEDEAVNEYRPIATRKNKPRRAAAAKATQAIAQSIESSGGEDMEQDAEGEIDDDNYASIHAAHGNQDDSDEHGMVSNVQQDGDFEQHMAHHAGGFVIEDDEDENENEDEDEYSDEDEESPEDREYTEEYDENEENGDKGDNDDDIIGQFETSQFTDMFLVEDPINGDSFESGSSY